MRQFIILIRERRIRRALRFFIVRETRFIGTRGDAKEAIYRLLQSNSLLLIIRNPEIEAASSCRGASPRVSLSFL